jgi:hypothetical protein
MQASMRPEHFTGGNMKAINIALACVLGWIASPSMANTVEAGVEGNFKNEYGAVWRPFLMTDLERVAEEIGQLQDIYEVDQTMQNGVVQANTGTKMVWLWLKGQGSHTLLRGQNIPKFQTNPIYSSIKYRNNEFYARNGNAIFKYNQTKKNWEIALKSNKKFTQFEVCPDGKILLICPGLTKEIVLLEGDMSPELYSCSDDYQLESLRLLEIYGNTKDRRYEGAVEFPDTIKEIFKTVNRVPMIDKVFWAEDVLFLLNSQLGQILVYDVQKSAISLLKAPWPMLDWSFLNSNQPILPNLKERGVIKISRFSFPDRLLCYPQGRGRVLIQVRMPSGFEPGFSAERDRTEWLHGNRFVPLSKEYTEEEKKRKLWIKHYLFDWSQNQFREVAMPRVMGSKVDCSKHYLRDSDIAIPLTVPVSDRLGVENF